MKKCLKCNKEYEDSDNFCPQCGEKLVETNVCQKCGHPVATEDVYCRHCGYKIEKEYHCEKCGALITEGAKFCSECGNNVANPIVSIVSNGKPSTPMQKSKIEKILFYVVNAVALVLFVLMLIGCFGDISKSYYSYNGTPGTSSITSIKYFFGDAIKNYKQQMESVQYAGFDAVISLEITLKYIFWIVAIGSTIFGLIYGSIGLYKAYKNNDYSEKNSVLPITAFGTIPYLIIIALTNNLNVIATSVGEKAEYGVTFGWGTMMIFFFFFIYITVAAINKLISSILEKKNIAFESILCGIKLALGIIFLISFGQVVSIFLNASGATARGYATTYSIVISNLYAFSTGATTTFTTECISMLVAIGLILTGTFFGIFFLTKLFNFKKIVQIYIFGLTMVAFLLAGYIVSAIAIKNYAKGEAIAFLGITSDAFGISVIGIVFVVLTALSLIGLPIVKKILKK